MALTKRRPGLVYPVREDWHYVGEAGEPAFGTDWDNAASDRNLAFRIRETGVVDVQGYIENTAAPSEPSSAVLFVLPAQYRPTVDTDAGAATIETDDFSADGFVSAPVRVTSTGSVTVTNINVDPVFDPAPYVGVAQYMRIFGQFYLNPADAP